MELGRGVVAAGVVLALGCTSAPEQRVGTSSPPSTAGRAEPSLGACARLPFWNVYEQAGAVTKRDEGTLVLDVAVDVHSADCGAPDCWGHEMALTLRLEPRQGRCEIVAATSSARPFNQCGTAIPGTTSPWSNTFVAVGNPNLAKPNLERIHLYDPARREALVLLPYAYYFYAGVAADTPLKLELEADEIAPGHAYGYSKSSVQSWRTRYWPSK